MPIPKKYFHDRAILLLLSVSTFLVLLLTVLILLRLDSGRANGYIVQYRANLGISAFETGRTAELLAFIAFAVIITVINIILSMRTYEEERRFSLSILGFGILLLTLSIIVSNALLVLR